MGFTTIRDEEGTLLWQANDFGEYSNMKTGVIAEILSELLKDITVKVETHSGDQPITDVYTKEQADARFIQITIFPLILEGQINTMIQEGKILGLDTVNLINSRLLLLYKSCFGTDLDGVHVQTGFDLRIQDLEDTSDFLYNRVIRISRDIYKINGGEVDINELVIAKLSETGRVENLSPDISDRSNMVAAINAVNSDLDSRVSDIETQNGDETLTTTAQTLSGAVNELDDRVGSMLGTLGTLNTTVSGLTEGVGNVNQLDSGFTNKEVVSALNQLISSVNSLTQRVGSLESRVSALEGN